MGERVLITGGAGFIGSHLADELRASGHEVRVLDCLDPQVHGPERARPAYLHPGIELVRGDVRDPQAVRAALDGVDAVCHLAAAVGVGQSMYELSRYTEVNELGTAVLLQALIERPVRRLVVASSMSVYGEGSYLTAEGARAPRAQRSRDQLEEGQWEPLHEGRPLLPCPTPEEHDCALASVYALNKYAQERMCLLTGEAYGIPTVALRFFNVYGPRQALGNPYTGVLAIFAARLLNDRPPVVFEDGLQRRDFVSVHDVARACRLALQRDGASGQVLNIGSGQPRSVLDVAAAMAQALGREGIAPEVTGEYRVGDIRHCFADISRARRLLGYAPRVPFEDGLRELAGWLASQEAQDRTADMRHELSRRGLTLGGDGQRGRVTAPRPAPGPRLGKAPPRPLHGPVLVTGGAGFVGANLADRLARRGEQVLLYDDLSRPGVEENLRWLTRRHGERVAFTRGDVRDAERLRAAVRGVSQVFHFAAQVAVTTSLDGPLEDFQVNAGGTLTLLEAMRAEAPRAGLVFTSTNKVYGALSDLPLREGRRRWEPLSDAARMLGVDESRPLDLHSPYGCSKGAADQYVLDYARCYGLSTVVLRMSCIYGPHQFGTPDQGWVCQLVRSALEGEEITIYGDGKQVRDVLFVSDLVDALLRVSRRSHALAGQAFNVGGGPGNVLSLLELLDLIESLEGQRPAVRYADWRPGDQRYYVSHTGKLRAATGWVPRVSPRQGVRRLRDWLLATQVRLGAVPARQARSA